MKQVIFLKEGEFLKLNLISVSSQNITFPIGAPTLSAPQNESQNSTVGQGLITSEIKKLKTNNLDTSAPNLTRNTDSTDLDGELVPEPEAEAQEENFENSSALEIPLNILSSLGFCLFFIN